MWGYLNRGEKRMPEIKSIDEVLEDGKAYPLTDLGFYPIIYICEDGGVLCADCVNDNLELIRNAKKDHDPQWNVIGYDVYYEGPIINCDNCNKDIESAYGDPDAEED